MRVLRLPAEALEDGMTDSMRWPRSPHSAFDCAEAAWSWIALEDLRGRALVLHAEEVADPPEALVREGLGVRGFAHGVVVTVRHDDLGVHRLRLRAQLPSAPSRAARSPSKGRRGGPSKEAPRLRDELDQLGNGAVHVLDGEREADHLSRSRALSSTTMRPRFRRSSAPSKSPARSRRSAHAGSRRVRRRTRTQEVERLVVAVEVREDARMEDDALS